MKDQAQTELVEFEPEDGTSLDDDLRAVAAELEVAEVEADEPGDEPEDIGKEHSRETEADIASKLKEGLDPTPEVPEHWSEEDKALLAKLPNDTARRDFLALYKRMETGANEKFEQAAEARKFHDEVGQLIAPFDAELQAAGLTRVDGIKRLVDAERLLRQNPQAGLQWLLDQYGAGQYQIVPKGAHPQPNGKDNGVRDPRVDAILAERAEQERAAQIAQQRQMVEQTNAAQTRIKEFAEAKDDAGNLKYPHFQAVRSTMGALIQGAVASGQQLSLEDAYQQAAWANPALREELTKAQQEAAAKSAAEQRKEAVRKARAASTPRTASQFAAIEDGEDDEDIEVTMRKVAADIGARV